MTASGPLGPYLETMFFPACSGSTSSQFAAAARTCRPTSIPVPRTTFDVRFHGLKWVVVGWSRCAGWMVRATLHERER
jgi:hypothetical protein